MDANLYFIGGIHFCVDPKWLSNRIIKNDGNSYVDLKNSLLFYLNHGTCIIMRRAKRRGGHQGNKSGKRK